MIMVGMWIFCFLFRGGGTFLYPVTCMSGTGGRTLGTPSRKCTWIRSFCNLICTPHEEVKLPGTQGTGYRGTHYPGTGCPGPDLMLILISTNLWLGRPMHTFRIRMTLNHWRVLLIIIFWIMIRFTSISGDFDHAAFFWCRKLYPAERRFVGGDL